MTKLAVAYWLVACLACTVLGSAWQPVTPWALARTLFAGVTWPATLAACGIVLAVEGLGYDVSDEALQRREEGR